MTTTSNKTSSRAKKAITGTKQDRVLAMLRSKRGTTIAAIVTATGWHIGSISLIGPIHACFRRLV